MTNMRYGQRASLPGLGLQVQIQQKLVIFAISKCRSEAKRTAASKYNAIQIHHIYKDNIWKSKIGWRADARFTKWRIACKYNGNTKIIFAKSKRGCRWEAKLTKRRADRGGWEASPLVGGRQRWGHPRAAGGLLSCQPSQGATNFVIMIFNPIS